MKSALSSGALVACLLSSVAIADDVTLIMTNGNGGGGEFNTVAFAITNNVAGASIAQVQFTVGNTQYLFDQLYLGEELFTGGNGSQTASLLVGDRSDDNAGPDLFRYGFTNFGTGVTFRGQWDIDNDNGDFNADARQVMFNNGDAPNAILTISFSDGSVWNFAFPDQLAASSYTFMIPSPAAGSLAAIALLAGARRRSR